MTMWNDHTRGKPGGESASPESLHDLDRFRRPCSPPTLAMLSERQQNKEEGNAGAIEMPGHRRAANGALAVPDGG